MPGAGISGTHEKPNRYPHPAGRCVVAAKRAYLEGSRQPSIRRLESCGLTVPWRSDEKASNSDWLLFLVGHPGSVRT